MRPIPRYAVWRGLWLCAGRCCSGVARGDFCSHAALIRRRQQVLLPWCRNQRVPRVFDAAWLFRLLGRNVGTAVDAQAVPPLPLTASFGILAIMIYAILAIFAGVIAPYGQDEIIQGVAANIIPGGDPAMGGNPAFPLGTDQIGRDILSRLIYGAQNTVGIAFATTLLAFFIGGSLGFLAAVVGGWLTRF